MVVTCQAYLKGAGRRFDVEGIVCWAGFVSQHDNVSQHDGKNVSLRVNVSQHDNVSRETKMS